MNEITKKNIGKRLNEVLAQKGIMQKELAEHIGVTANTVSYYLSGERCPDIEKLIEIAKYLNITTDYLLGISDVKSIDTELKAVCEYTGLSEEAINNIRCHYDRTKETENNIDVLRFQFINSLFSSTAFDLLALECALYKSELIELDKNIADLGFNIDYEQCSLPDIMTDLYGNADKKRVDAFKRLKMARCDFYDCLKTFESCVLEYSEYLDSKLCNKISLADFNTVEEGE